MPTDPQYPEFPIADRDGWRLADERVGTVFQLPAMRVRGATRQYEDEATRQAVRETTNRKIDHRWRFAAATRLGFVPGLPPGTMPAAILPTVRREARQSFTDTLRERGVENVERDRRERMRTRSGARCRLTSYDGVTRVDGTGIPVTGWVGAWYDRPDFYVVTGGYPSVRLTDALDVEDAADEALTRTPNEARDELLSAFREVT